MRAALRVWGIDAMHAAIGQGDPDALRELLQDAPFTPQRRRYLDDLTRRWAEETTQRDAANKVHGPAASATAVEVAAVEQQAMAGFVVSADAHAAFRWEHSIQIADEAASLRQPSA